MKLINYQNVAIVLTFFVGIIMSFSTLAQCQATITNNQGVVWTVSANPERGNLVFIMANCANITNGPCNISAGSTTIEYTPASDGSIRGWITLSSGNQSYTYFYTNFNENYWSNDTCPCIRLQGNNYYYPCQTNTYNDGIELNAGATGQNNGSTGNIIFNSSTKKLQKTSP